MAKLVGMGGRKKGLNVDPKPMDPSSMKDIKCENCGCQFFRQVHAFKRVSALVSETGKEQIIPVPTFRCDECGFINEEFRIIEGK
jgi:uncharacterized Zn finger protein|tara:strand:+ start:665 stop:919 length:255 start_codon:yes stop_codon:yes gene_type:complete